MSPLSRRSRRRKVKKGSRRSPWPTGSSLEERIDEIMDRVQQAGDDHAERSAALEEYLALARAHEDETWFDAAAWSEDLADSYLALGRIDDAGRTVGDVTRRGYAEGAEMLCELAGKLMRSGYEPQARLVWQQARAEAPEWLTTGLELALRTGDPEGALEQLCPLRASWPRLGGRPTKFSSTRPRRKHT
jgi:hypothetical protein